MLRESGMSKAEQSSRYARSKRKSPQNGVKNLLWRERIGKHGAEEAEKKYAAWDKLPQQLFMRRK
jgi:hypothetical protein